jgi:hypothetical protein
LLPSYLSTWIDLTLCDKPPTQEIHPLSQVLQNMVKDSFTNWIHAGTYGKFDILCFYNDILPNKEDWI